jgi:hypothetical protein
MHQHEPTHSKFRRHRLLRHQLQHWSRSREFPLFEPLSIPEFDPSSPSGLMGGHQRCDAPRSRLRCRLHGDRHQLAEQLFRGEHRTETSGRQEAFY